MPRPALLLALLGALVLRAPGVAAHHHEPWLLAAIETELGPRFSGVLADASRRPPGRGGALAGLWTPEGDGCRDEMLALLPGERSDGFQHWRRVAPGGTMAPVRVGRWQETAGALAVQVALVAPPEPLAVPPPGAAGTAFRPLDWTARAVEPLWRLAEAAAQEWWTVLESGGERLRLRLADGAEKVLQRCVVVAFRLDGRPAQPVRP
jgi:hypothetical protein